MTNCRIHGDTGRGGGGGGRFAVPHPHHYFLARIIFNVLNIRGLDSRTANFKPLENIPLYGVMHDE